MTPFDSLVRISRWHLDEKRQKLAELERLADRLRGDLRRLDEGIAAEQKLAEKDDMALRAYPAYLEAELNRRQRLEKSIADVEQEIEAAREEVNDAFRELKKYELAQSNEQERLRNRRQRVEQQRSDEVGAQLHRRHAADQKKNRP
jgi:flagellar export protein FliJ